MLDMYDILIVMAYYLFEERWPKGEGALVGRDNNFRKEPVFDM